MAQDIDFENFTIETDRASQIRDNISKLRDEAWLDDLRLLVAEFGQDVKEDDADDTLGLFKDQMVRVYQTPADHPAGSWTINLSGVDFRLLMASKAILELSFLPKGHEFVVLFIDEKELEALLSLKLGLKEEIKAARAKKADRAAAFKAKVGQ